ncbi:MAG: biotin/lipoyl-containing protein [Armatimonadota bacterium]|nr:biotin/lipoyl-binding protein [bacterium]MCS7309564.1 biotin/lipoyl-binding protein [Armatimonadota bacterium]MDW8104739.1 biotin/lipoyl-containing protein [Armatimonadota bacterium]MDW8291063.1 biotin/lipoyl-containing protein [Armatimonadota bacterium]
MERIERLLSLFHRSDASELEVETSSWRLRVRRQVALVLPEEEVELVAEPAPSQGEPAPVWIRAPLVGFFQPRSQPLRVGDRVQRGEVVCLIRAMGLPNEVRSPIDGRVVEVLVEEGVAVEYGQPLYRLEEEYEAVA